MDARVRDTALVGVCLMALALTLAGCGKADTTLPAASVGSPPTPSEASQVKPMAVALQPRGGTEAKSVTVRTGDTLVVILESNASTGYTWSLTSEPDPSVMTSAGKQIQPPATPMPGAPGQQVFTFSAAAPGTTEFTLTYAQPFGDEKAYQTDTFTVTVT